MLWVMASFLENTIYCGECKNKVHVREYFSVRKDWLIISLGRKGIIRFPSLNFHFVFSILKSVNHKHFALESVAYLFHLFSNCFFFSFLPIGSIATFYFLSPPWCSQRKPKSLLVWKLLKLEWIHKKGKLITSPPKSRRWKNLWRSCCKNHLNNPENALKKENHLKSSLNLLPSTFLSS